MQAVAALVGTLPLLLFLDSTVKVPPFFGRRWHYFYGPEVLIQDSDLLVDPLPLLLLFLGSIVEVPAFWQLVALVL